MEILSKRIRDLRVDADLRQSELASQIGITQNMVSNYENGRDIPPAVVIQYAKHFDVSCDWLLGLTSNKARSATTIGAGLDAVAQMMKADDIVPLSVSEIDDLVQHLESYFCTGAPAGVAPVSCIRAFLVAMCDVLKAASEKDLPGLIEKTNAAASSVLSVNDILKKYIEKESN